MSRIARQWSALEVRKGASAIHVVEYLVPFEEGSMEVSRAVDLTPLGERVIEW
jgi:hypothetical protein